MINTTEISDQPSNEKNTGEHDIVISWDLLTDAQKNLMIHTRVLERPEHLLCEWTTKETFFDEFQLHRGCLRCGHLSEISQFYGHVQMVPDYVGDYNHAIEALRLLIDRVGISYLELAPLPILTADDICCTLARFLGITI